MELREITTGVWTFEFGFKIAPGVHFPTRSTILKLAGQRIAVISPGPFDEEALSRIQELGLERWVIAPNMVHYLNFEQALEQLGSTTGWAPDLLHKKAPNLSGCYRPLDELGRECEDLDVVHLRGNPFLDEYVFLHRPSNTLVVTDFAFHMRKPYSGLTGAVLALVGCYNRLGQSRLVNWTMKDKAAFRESVGKMRAWQPDRVIVGHGDVIINPREVWQPFLDAMAV